MKWGTRYPAFYANRLAAGVRAHLGLPHRFICLTDDPEGLDPAIEARPLPDIALPQAHAMTPWRKLSVWNPDLDLPDGDILFLDIDLLITGRLDAFFTFRPFARYCVIENWTQVGRGIGNTSAFRFRKGGVPEAYATFAADPGAVLSRHRIEQHYLSEVIPDQTFWPRDWCLSFKHSLVPPFPLNWLKSPRLPTDTRIVVFTGRPDIEEAARGRWPAPLHKKIYKHIRPARWIEDHAPFLRPASDTPPADTELDDAPTSEAAAMPAEEKAATP